MRVRVLTVVSVLSFLLVAGSANAYVRVDGTGLNNPQGVAVDGSGKVFIADTFNNRVVEDTPSSGGYVQSVLFNSTTNGLNNPRGVVVDPSGDVFIADAYNSRVLRETPNGSGGYTQSVVFTGSSGMYPSGVAVDSSGDVFVADKDIYELTPNGSGGYNAPTDIINGGFTGFFYQLAIDGSGDLFIADGFGNQVLKEAPTSSGGYSQSVVASGLSGPEGVVLDGAGDVFVSDTFNNRLLEEVPNSSGGYAQTVIASSGLSAPAQLARDASGGLFIADQSNNRVVELGPATWTGGASNGTPGSASTWSAGGNWSGGNPLTGGNNGTLTFPTIASCNSSVNPCDPYYSQNDLTGAIVRGIVIDDKSPYQVSGNSITLGAGGITTTTSGPAGHGFPHWSAPIALGANQTWSIDGANNSGRLILGSPVTGSAYTLGVNLTNYGNLDLSGDNELGALTFSGSGEVYIDGSGGSLNATDGNDVTLTDVGLFTSANLSTGPLTVNHSGNSGTGTLQLGASAYTPILSVNGTANLGSSSSTLFNLDSSTTTPTPGTNASELTATGNITLGGFLALSQNNAMLTCPSSITPGTVFTLVQSTVGLVSGTFSNAPEGGVASVDCSGGTQPALRIHYASNSVTGTVVTPTTTSFRPPSPSSAVTNQTVTLSANVAGSFGSSTPTGTVEFDNYGRPIAGCSAQPVDGSGNATCQTSFPAGADQLSAKYTPSSGSLFGPSSGRGTTSFNVSPGSTITGVSVSSNSPQTGQNVTYTATVTPGNAGPVEPSGTVEFDDQGGPISGCSSQPLSAGSSSSTASCTISYSSPGSHSITATYAGDSNFNGSDSSAQPQTVTVSSPPPPPPAAPSSSGPPTISGTAEQGQTLTESHGQWSNSPTGYAYQWEDCDSQGNNCGAISGATGQSYTLTSSDVSHTIRVTETASNSGGSAQATSAHTGVVTAPSPGEIQISTTGPVSRSGSTVNPGITLSCPANGPSCTATEQATVLIGAHNTPAGAQPAHAVSLGSASFTIPAGSSAPAVFELNQLGMTLLSDHQQLPLQLAVSGQAQGEPSVSATKTITLTGQFARYAVTSIKAARDGTVTVHVKVSAPGRINVLVSAWDDNIAAAARTLNPAPERLVVGRASTSTINPGTLTLHVHPTSQGRRLINHPAYRVTLRVWVSYIPLYAFQTDTGYYDLHTSSTCTACQKRTWP